MPDDILIWIGIGLVIGVLGALVRLTGGSKPTTRHPGVLMALDVIRKGGVHPYPPTEPRPDSPPPPLCTKRPVPTDIGKWEWCDCDWLGDNAGPSDIDCGCPGPDCKCRLYRDSVLHWQGKHWRVHCAFVEALRLLEEAKK